MSGARSFDNFSPRAISEKIKAIPKLGVCFREHFPDWKIVLHTPLWQKEEGFYVRKISHEGGGKSLCSAQVDVPEATFRHFQDEFESLGERSLGDSFLFVKPDIVRTSLEVFRNKQGQWLRASSFNIQGFPLEIYEYLTETGLECLLN